MPTSGLPRKGKLLLVSSTGGHLTELMMVSELLEARSESHWVTFENSQSASALAGKSVSFIPYIAPRDWLGAFRSIPTFWRLIRKGGYEGVVSTGAAVAVPALVTSLALGVRAHYVESVSRFARPSLTGRILARVPRVSLYTQHRRQADERWRYEVSIADALARRPEPVRRQGPPKIFVTLGTIQPYRFDSLVDRVRELLPPGAQVTWQLGATTREDLPGTVHDFVTDEQFEKLSREATTVITHAGIGSALQLLKYGVRPVVVPRRASRGEHVDDHQLEAVRAFEELGVGLCREVEDLTGEDLGLTVDVRRKQVPASRSGERRQPVG